MKDIPVIKEAIRKKEKRNWDFELHKFRSFKGISDGKFLKQSNLKYVESFFLSKEKKSRKFKSQIGKPKWKVNLHKEKLDEGR